VFQLANLKEATIHLDFEFNLAPTDADTDTALAAATAGWAGSPNLRRNFNSEIRYLRAVGFVFHWAANPSPPPPFIRVPDGLPRVSNLNQAGTHAGSASPPQCAVVVSFKSAVAARTGMGRCYLPSPPIDVLQTTGMLDPTYQQQLIDDFDNWVAGIQNSPTAPQTLVHTTGSPKLGTTQTVVDRLLHGRIDTMRKRLTRETALFTT
jgi:hypothetical protein